MAAQAWIYWVFAALFTTGAFGEAILARYQATISLRPPYEGDSPLPLSPAALRRICQLLLAMATVGWFLLQAFSGRWALLDVALMLAIRQVIVADRLTPFYLGWSGCLVLGALSLALSGNWLLAALLLLATAFPWLAPRFDTDPQPLALMRSRPDSGESSESSDALESTNPLESTDGLLFPDTSAAVTRLAVVSVSFFLLLVVLLPDRIDHPARTHEMNREGVATALPSVNPPVRPPQPPRVRSDHRSPINTMSGLYLSPVLLAIVGIGLLVFAPGSDGTSSTPFTPQFSSLANASDPDSPAAGQS